MDGIEGGDGSDVGDRRVVVVERFRCIYHSTFFSHSTRVTIPQVPLF
jgi:hypothetical protein